MTRKLLRILGVILALIIVLIISAVLIMIVKINAFHKLSDIKEITSTDLVGVTEATDSSISIDWKEAMCEINDNVYGLAWADWLDVLPPVEMLDQLDLSTIRFGGNDFSRFDTKTENFYKESGVSKSPRDMGENIKWFTDNDVDVIWQVNMLGYAIDLTTNSKIEISSPEAAVAYIEKMNATYKIKIKYINLDNEPLIWSATHPDLHPEATSYEEYLTKFISYASAIKAYDSSIKIMGPESCNPYYYYNSDVQADAAKGNWLEYFLTKCNEYEAENGVRLLDVLTVHRYPIFRSLEGNTVTSSNQEILNSARAWWDEAFSYSGDPTVYQKNGIITYLKRLIDECYPNTELGITEYNLDFNPDVKYDKNVRAVWLADTLGIFASNGLDYGVYWNIQDSKDIGLISIDRFTVNDATYGDKRPVFYAFYLMTNYMRGTAVTTACDNSSLKVYAAKDGDSQNIIVINADCEKDISSNINSGIPSLGDVNYTFPKMSITVFSVSGDGIKLYQSRFSED